MEALVVAVRLADGIGWGNAEEEQEDQRQEVVERVVDDAPEEVKPRHVAFRRGRADPEQGSTVRLSLASAAKLSIR